MLEPFVDITWLRSHQAEVALADVRWYPDGRSVSEAYAAGHLPGAVLIALDSVLAAPPGDGTGGRHPLPSPERFARGLAAAGISDTDTVIAYDDTGGVIAARLVWLLRALGHDAALLDGGLGAWPTQTLAHGDQSEGEARHDPNARFVPAPWPEHAFVSIEEVAAATRERACDHTVLIDARDASRFSGGPDQLDPRSGHIPGARSVPTREHLDAGGRIISPERLRERFAQAGITPASAVISYCGSGVTACHNLLALERAGLGPGRLFPGSWSQWSRDPARPLETGADPAASPAPARPTRSA